MGTSAARCGRRCVRKLLHEKDYAISTELSCLDSFTGDEVAILDDFLDGCHYAA